MWSRAGGRQGRSEPRSPVPAEVVLDPDRLAGQLQDALDVIGEGIVICDLTGDVVYQNAAGERELSSAPGDVLAVQAVSDLLAQALTGRSPERRLDLLSPSRRSLWIRAFPINGGAVAVVEDVSERLRLDAIRKDFVANVSHELKTPIGALTLLAETIDGETQPDVVARLARRMGAEADRLSRIIDDLLDLSRIEANETPRKELVPVEAIVAEAVESLQTVADKLDVIVKVERAPAGLAVPGEKHDLISAVANLVDNAIKYSEPGGEVRISVQAGGPGVELSVSDQGVGIPARDMERIFERFYRVDRARARSTGGTGLGLSIVRHVVANHGGDVRVESVEGAGSTFVLGLPAVTLTGGTPSTDGGEPVA